MEKVNLFWARVRSPEECGVSIHDTRNFGESSESLSMFRLMRGPLEVPLIRLMDKILHYPL